MNGLISLTGFINIIDATCLKFVLRENASKQAKKLLIVLHVY